MLSDGETFSRTDTKEDGKGKRWPRSAAKFYGISLVVLI